MKNEFKTCNHGIKFINIDLKHIVNTVNIDKTDYSSSYVKVRR